jgi:c-di-GMP-binding flagellar brake protein YcgR
MEDPYTGPDRRKFKRLKVSFIVFYKVDSPLHVRMLIGDREVNAIMLDLSESGMAILTNYKMPESALLSIKFILVNEKTISKERVKSMAIKGLVRYSVLAEKRAYRLGIYFTDITEDDREAIANFVRMTLN